ncbi:MAG TPA: hypothetical protein VG013_13030 [Gemmataceae bacterium]|jgi:hypothetical protein|nr:hypothetical protein [Gemmataceae bacterium]
MSLFRQTLFRLTALVGLAGAPAFAQPPSPGVYTYSFGYNPGYYGSAIRPADSGGKPGQAVASWHGHYRYVYRGPQLPQGTPRSQAPQSR